MQDRSIAVVGATGFLGSSLVGCQRRAGRRVAGFNQANPPVIGGQPTAGLREADVVLFLAARMSPSLAARRPDRVAAERALFLEVLNAVSRGDKRPTFVLASSGTVYAPSGLLPYAEDAPVGPTTAYGTAKRRLERDLEDHADGVRPVALRIGNVYGPDQDVTDGYGVLQHWLHAAHQDLPLRLIGDPLAVRDYVYISDVADLLNRICDRTAELPQVINVGSGTSTTLAALLDVVSHVVGRELEVVRENGRSSDRQATTLETTLAFSALGWRPRTSLVDGVRHCWDRMQASLSGSEAVSRR